MSRLLTGDIRVALEGSRLPADWDEAPLAEIGGFKNGINKGADSFGHGFPFVNLMDVFGITRIRDTSTLGLVNSSEIERRNYDLREGDVLFVRSSVKPSGVGLATLVARSLPDTVFSGFLLRFRSDDRLANSFKAYLFSEASFRNRVIGASTVSANTNINQRSLGSISVRFPLSKLEQESIAQALTDADLLIATLERLIAKKQAIKRGMMQQLLTGKTRLPGFTEPWREVLLGDHVTYVKTVALSRAQLDTTSPLLYLHYGDIHTRSAIRLAAATETMPRAAQHLAGSAGRLRIGDVVFADASEDPDGVGKSVEIASVPNDGVIPGLHTIAARFDKAILADGFKAYLQFIPTFRESLLRLAAGTKVLATTRSYISSVTLSLPTVDEQRAIAQALTDSDDEIDALRLRLTKAKAIKHGMMQELLTGRTRLPVAGVAS